MDKIALIRQEIERLKKYAEESKKEWINEGYTQNAFAEDCRITSFDGLLSFIDSLSEEPVCLDDGGAPSKQKCGDCTIACEAKVEEEPDKSLEEAAEEYEDWVESYSQSDFPTCVSFRQAFIAGAQWQAEQDDRDVVFWKGMQYAIAGMKEDAVDGIYTKSMDGKNVFVESGALKIDPESVKVGDSVKLIIIKDDGKSD